MALLYGILQRSNLVLVHYTLRSLGRRTHRARWLHHVGPTRNRMQADHCEYERFGSYSVILPEEPFVWGVSHIKPRHVPAAIPRPPYAEKHSNTSQEHAESGFWEPYEGDGRIRLNSIEETKLRESAKLASKVRQYASSLVRVEVFAFFWNVVH